MEHTTYHSRAAVKAVGGLIFAALTLAAAPASATDDHDTEPPDRGYCTATARLMLSACTLESRDDLFKAKAKCINASDARDRAACLREAREARNEVAGTCREQHDARRAICALVGEERYDPPFEPHLFDADFRHLSNPNPYFPLGIGNKREYRGGGETVITEFLDRTKFVAGVTCIVMRDLVWVDGKLKEATDDWFGAARDGSTWYCGEEVKDYEFFEGDRPQRPELVSIDGSFKHGVDGDKGGIIMPARPRVGQVYREEFSLGNAEDVAQVLSVNYSYGQSSEFDRLVPRALADRLCNRDCVVTRNFSASEPGIYALKYYARGIGFFLETKPVEGESVQLVACNFDTRCVALPSP
jgi:hypothetical protein